MMAKKQTTPKQAPKPAAKKVTPARLRQVSDSIATKSHGNFVGAHSLMNRKEKDPVIKNVNNQIAKKMLKTVAKQDSTVAKYGAQLKAHAAKKKK